MLMSAKKSLLIDSMKHNISRVQHQQRHSQISKEDVGGVAKEEEQIINVCLEQAFLTYYNNTFDFIATLQVCPFVLHTCVK
jgi:hypothetical protein